MRIAHKRIRIVENYLTGIAQGAKFYVGISDLNHFANQLAQIGFGNIIIGQQVLPTVIGRITNFNANGGHSIIRNQPKETVYRESEIKDWHGNYHTVYIPYQRFRRQPIPAPNVELTIQNGANNNPLLISPILMNNAQSMANAKHIVNMFLEIFGECEILQDNLLPAFNVQVTRLNWNVLPAGNYPWQVLQQRVQGVINAAPQHRRNIIQRRIVKLSSFTPNFVAVGTAGFRGYMVFGFDNKNFFILESIYTGNATYVLGQNWQQISQLTKEQIITQNLQQQRIVHTQNWDIQIDNLLV